MPEKSGLGSKAFRVGLFVLATLAILAAAVFLIGGKEFRFTSTYHLKTNFKNVAGLDEGAPVRIGGISKGTVEHIELPKRSDGQVLVDMRLDSKTKDVLKKDSVASIKTEGLLGNKYVEISFGFPSAERLKDGDTIASQAPIDVEDLIKKTDGILSSAQDTMQNADAIAAKLNNGQGTVGALLNDKGVYRELNNTMAQAQTGTTEFSEDMEALKHNFLLRGFFKNRGYEDEAELQKTEIARLPSESEQNKFTFDAAKLFTSRTGSKLKDKKMLNPIGQSLATTPFGLAVVVVRGPTIGESDKLLELTEGRAMAVRDYLASNFKVDDSRIRIMGLGKANDANDANKVEVIVYPPGVNPPAPVKPVPAG
jgi:phospholipid/cholesterol/gamma-HCH transport system substrate-binding protein